MNLIISSDCALKSINRKSIIFNMTTGSIMELNEMGALILEIMKVPTSVDSLLDLVFKVYDIKENDLNDVKVYIEKLKERGIVVITNSKPIESAELFYNFYKIYLSKNTSASFTYDGGSMRSTINCGQKLLVHGVENISDIRVGDLVAFLSGDRCWLVVHRCIDIVCEGDKLKLITKGDDLTHNDYPVDEDRLLGRALIGNKIKNEKPKLKKCVVNRTEGEYEILFNNENGKFFVSNSFGKIILEQLNGNNQLSDIATYVINQIESPNVKSIYEDIENFIVNLYDKGLVDYE